MLKNQKNKVFFALFSIKKVTFALSFIVYIKYKIKC